MRRVLAASLSAVFFAVTPAIAQAAAPPPSASPPSIQHVARPHPVRLAAVAAARPRVRVRPGDTLSSVARRVLGSSRDWPVLWWDNKREVPDPNVITAGQRLVYGDWHRVKHWLWRRASAAIPHAPPGSQSASAPGPAPVTVSYTPAGSLQQYAARLFGAQYGCAASIIIRESGWNVYATNPQSGAYGIPQALPGSKMASAGADWATNGFTQLRWMLGYVNSVYRGACNAWAFWQGHGYY